MCGLRSTKNNGTGFCPSGSVFACHYYSASALFSYLCTILPLPEGQAGEARVPSKKQCFFFKMEEHWIDKEFHSFAFKR
jgi:hypothetical protein